MFVDIMSYSIHISFDQQTYDFKIRVSIQKNDTKIRDSTRTISKLCFWEGTRFESTDLFITLNILITTSVTFCG